jgi:NAD(P)-dependent dehydrogenase (short-subunit alcohol dehydrogenase family)
MSNKLTVIVGAGPGNGLAFGRRFRAEGHRVAMLARHAENLQPLLPDAHYFSCDVSEPGQI